ncbi:adenosylcobinamide-GDP ribazoletransferase [Halomarina salina]|uniref:Adenosylcobinamide-GDP ribazoletransferase n=1 Tax=Halomarina salina TaxID=1872699 RepID=A0ABD5RHT6_9EURY
MVATALRGALGFLTRAPVGRDEAAWEAFRTTPVAFPLAGYPVGALAAVPLLAPGPSLVVAAVFVAWCYALTGINHLDGVADLGDAAVVHGDAERRRSVLKDTTVGVGAVVAVSLVVLGLWSSAGELAALPTRAALVVVAAEVSAKLATAVVVCLGTATHEGLGSALTDDNGLRDLLSPVVLTLPAATLTWPRPASAVTVLAGGVTGLATLLWARRRLGGVNGDVMGATNELARVVALAAGVTTWTLC